MKTVYRIGLCIEHDLSASTYSIEMEVRGSIFIEGGSSITLSYEDGEVVKIIYDCPVCERINEFALDRTLQPLNTPMTPRITPPHWELLLQACRYGDVMAGIEIIRILAPYWGYDLSKEWEDPRGDTY